MAGKGINILYFKNGHGSQEMRTGKWKDQNSTWTRKKQQELWPTPKHTPQKQSKYLKLQSKYFVKLSKYSKQTEFISHQNLKIDWTKSLDSVSSLIYNLILTKQILGSPYLQTHNYP